MSVPTYLNAQESGKPVRSGMRQLRDVTIPATDAISSSIDLRGETPVGIIMSAAWTEASIALEVSFNNIDFFQVYDMAGDPVIAVSPTVDTYIALPVAHLLGTRWLRLVSVDVVDNAADEDQAAIRVLTVVSLP